MDSFDSTEETASFIGKLISAENDLKNAEQFWHIWNNLYPKIKELCSNNPHHYHLQEIIINYLLARHLWCEDIKEWHSLKRLIISHYAIAYKENYSIFYLGDLESNTLYYLEKFLRKLIFTDRQKIRENIRLKTKIISILDFMIERGSVHGYLLRESIL